MAVVLVVVTVVGGIALVSIQITTRTLRDYEHRTEMLRDRRFQGFLSMHYALYGDWSSVQSEVEQIGQITGERVILANLEAQIIADSENQLIGQSVKPDWPPPAAWLMDGDTPIGALYVGGPKHLEPVGAERVLSSVNRMLLLVDVGAGLGAVLLIMGLSRRILAPVEALTTAARQMEAGDLSQRVAISSPDEIGDLARAFNGMADGLAQLEQLRRNMVTDVAHELRTPLTNLRGYLEALRDGVVELDGQLIDSLCEEAVLLSNLVNDLQELAMAEAGQLRLMCQPVMLRDIVNRSLKSFEQRAEAQQVELKIAVPGELPLVNVDPQRIGQVLYNLIENSLTHTPAGGKVGVSARLCSEEMDELWVEVQVWDTGSGIAPQDLPYVFERFYRADKSRSRATGGVGLGLAIVQQLVAAHGGKIQATSEPGEGACFTFTLPAISGDRNQ